jgi:hypothetical protein
MRPAGSGQERKLGYVWTGEDDANMAKEKQYVSCEEILY